MVSSVTPKGQEDGIEAPRKGGISAMLPLASTESSWNFITGGTDHTLHHWSLRETETKQDIVTTSLPSRHTAGISCIVATFDSGGHTMVVGGLDRAFTVYNVQTTKFNIVRKCYTAGAIYNAAFAPHDPNMLAVEQYRTGDRVQLFE